jgi:hypothetical protein
LNGEQRTVGNLARKIGASVYSTTEKVLIPSHNEVAMITIAYTLLVIGI